jgi:hypothetical protein
MRIRCNVISTSLSVSLILSFVLAMAWTATAQTATFFAAKNDATEYKLFRYEVTPTTTPILERIITDTSMVYPLGLTLSPAGELFVVNQGTHGGLVTRFLNPTVLPVFNGTIPAGPEMTFYGAFRGNELFLCQRFSGVLRFIVDPITGFATPNGQIPITRTIGEFRGIVVAPWGELFVSESAGFLPAKIHRIAFDTNGNAQSNGVISNPNMGQTHGMVFSPWGELFATSPSNHSIARFAFDTAKNASYNGNITGGGLNVPLDVSFAPWGELFVGNCLGTGTFSPGAYQGISRFNFDAAHVATANGTVTTPFPISSIAFVPPTDSTAPTTIAALNPNADAEGWNNSDVNVSLSSTDNTGGTSVREIVYSATGAQTIPSTTVDGASAEFEITAEGETVISYYAIDNGGNIEAVQSLVVRIDKTAPDINLSRTPAANAAGGIRKM